MNNVNVKGVPVPAYLSVREALAGARAEASYI